MTKKNHEEPSPQIQTERHSRRDRIQPPLPEASRPLSGVGDEDAKTNRTLDFGVVGLCASAGGLEAFKAFLDAMPQESGMAFIVVPHLDPNHPSLMAQLLAPHSKMPIEEASDGVPVVPDHVYVIPPGRFLRIESGVLRLTPTGDDAASVSHRQTAIDVFLRSLAEDQQQRAVGVVLSGTGSLGTLGLREIKDHGGLTLVQDPASARFDAMPRSAIAAKVADQVLAPRHGARLVGL
ncbi:MAG: chemotaxis protein CheB [Thiohalocapsa sp.]